MRTTIERRALRALLALAAAVALGSVAVGAGTATAIPASTERVALSSFGTQPDADVNREASLTPDARYVVFASDSPNLAPGATGGTGPFVYVRDRTAGTTELVSRGLGGASPNGGSVTLLGAPVISADGRYVAFASFASNLVPDDGNGAADVFVFDRVAATTRRVSVADDSGQANGQSLNPSISADGRFVAFQSSATNLAGDDTNGTTDVFVRNLGAGTTTRVSVGAGGVDANGPSTVTSGALSADANFIAFASTAGNLVTNDQNGFASDVFVRRLPAGPTQLASLGSGGAQLSSATVNGFLNADGRFLAYQCTDICGATTGNVHPTGIFVRDRQSGEVREANVSSGGEEANSSVFFGGLSPDGHHVAFASNASNLAGASPFGTFDLYVRDVTASTTERVSVSTAGDPANDASFTSGQILGADGRFVLFASPATNVVSGDTNGRRDLFLRDRGSADAPPPLPPDPPGPGPGPGPVFTDTTAPTITCDQPSPDWHGDNITLSCTATDAGSGIAAADAAFGLSTTVADDSFDGNAATDSRLVCDLAGNCAGAGPITGIKVDRTTPTIHCAGPDGAWHRTDVSVQCTALDSGSGLAAGTASVFFLSTDVPPDHVEFDAWTDARTICDAVGHCTGARVTGFKIDEEGPKVSCAHGLDGLWHGDNVSIPCTASDIGAGLADPADAAFTLSTAVAAGDFDEDASTPGRDVCDAVMNCTVQPGIAPWKIDRDPPFFLTRHVYPFPNANGWNNSDVTVEWECADHGSGPVPEIVELHLASEGAAQHATTVCRDKVGNTTAASGVFETEINIDRTPPKVQTLVLSASVRRVGTATAFATAVTDQLSGVAGAELFVGTDPGEGHGIPATLLGPLVTGQIASSLTAGVYPVCVRARDRADNWSAPSCNSLVVYDPSAGWIDGNGQVATSQGIGHVTFDARYVGKTATPTGALHFRIPAAGLDFRSNAEQWLVVSGGQAQLRGTGTVGGAGSYAFQLTIRDGSPDRLRIKIWDVSTKQGNVIFDTQPGALDGAAPTTPLSQGSLRIH
jgi:Tol biopolymer transport system component